VTTAPTNDDLARALAVVSEIVRAKGRESGANLGNALRRELPGFTPQAHGFGSLSQLLSEAADDLVVVDRMGNDKVWALGEYVSDRDIEQALGPSDDEGEPVSPQSNLATDHIELVNFRSCRRVRLDLAPGGLTVLVGPNGAGKSTLLYGASYASQVTRGRLRALFSAARAAHRLRSTNAVGPMELAIGAGAHTELRLAADVTDEDTRFTVTLTSEGKVERWTSPGSRPRPPLSRRAASAVFWPSVFLKFRAEALAAPSFVVGGEPRLSFDGGGLPTVLAHLATTAPARLQQVVDGVREVVPEVEQTRQLLHRWDPPPGQPGQPDRPEFRYFLEVKMRGNDWVPADLLSEGTLFAFGVQAVLHQPTPPRMLIMDDIDRGLHPKAQRALIQQLTRLATVGSAGPQIIVTTHSPYILDEVAPEAVRVVRAVQGATRVRSLIDHPDWQEWKASMTSGEFWTFVGEDWMEQAP
jgi:predicted ATPase